MINLSMKTKNNRCPYESLPLESFFAQLANQKGNLFLDRNSNFQITSKDKIISFGSCFASKIKNICDTLGLNYLKNHDIHNKYNDKIHIEKNTNFSLNYGNIYTSKHLLQLIKRVLGKETQLPRILVDSKNRKRNSFRPNVLSYFDEKALRNDDKNHLKNISSIIKESNILVFTLGLTEHWIDKNTLYCLPQVPGCGVGNFDNKLYKYLNSELFEVVDEILECIHLIRKLNKNIKIILTLSPVPLVATYSGLSAVEANSYSKSLLRQAISFVQKEHLTYLEYFPSYEIMTNPHFINLNFLNNRRTVSDFGLELITDQFNRKFVGNETYEANKFNPNGMIKVSFQKKEKDDFNPSCDEENIYASYINNIRL